VQDIERRLKRWLVVGFSVSPAGADCRHEHMFRYRARDMLSLTPEQIQAAVDSGHFTHAELEGLQ